MKKIDTLIDDIESVIYGLGGWTRSIALNLGQNIGISANKRFSMIETEIDKLCSMSKQEIHDWYWSMEEIYKHNYNHLHNVFYPTQIKGFFDEFIFE